ncbi:MAG: Coenzyme F420 hydrogenase/dehydrogenase, beta subunit C-terminal domain [Candidatus Hydrothermarchaeales archaeon]
MATDPICKKSINEKTAKFKSQLEGEVYYFCGAECKRRFEGIKRTKVRIKDFLKNEEILKNPFGRLYVEIIKPSVCSLCGACVASCPIDVLDIVDNAPKLIGKCIACGVCYNQCPKTITNEIELIGRFNEAYTAKTMLPDVEGQDGGAVTSVLIFALEEGLIDSAVVTVKTGGNPWEAVPKVVETREELVKASGSVFSHSITIRALVEAIERGSYSVGFVGTPCNIEAVHKMQTSPYGLLHLFMRANVLKLGLMCMDSFEYSALRDFLEEKGVDLKAIEKMEIRKGKLKVTSDRGEMLFGLRELDKLRSNSCMFCNDFASEKADISFGNVGSSEGYTTVLTRSALGSTIFHEAVDSGYIAAEPLERSGLEKVLNLAKMKKIQLYTIHRRGQK